MDHCREAVTAAEGQVELWHARFASPGVVASAEQDDKGQREQNTKAGKLQT